jgi:hypothetical protein
VEKNGDSVHEKTDTVAKPTTITAAREGRAAR